MSEISDVLTYINDSFDKNPDFDGVPIYWDEIELSPNSISFPSLMFKLRAWKPTKGCDVAERVLEVRIMSNTQYPRDILLELWNYEESVREVMNEISMESTGFELEEVGGSEVLAMRPNRENEESYKAAKDLWSNLIVIYYKLRY